MVDESILFRIKKLYALAGDNNSEEEAASAAQKAQEMLLKYNISQDDIDGIELATVEAYINRTFTDHMQSSNVDMWKIILATAVSRGNLCRIVLHDQGRKIEWLGKPSNIEVGKFLFDTLCHDLSRIADERWKTVLTIRQLEKENGVSLFKEDTDLRYVHGKTWKNAFFVGASRVIEQRLSESLNLLKVNDGQIMALVTTNTQELNTFFREMYPRTGHFSTKTNVDFSGSGYKSGQAAGRSIQFKTGIGAGGSVGPRLLGRG